MVTKPLQSEEANEEEIVETLSSQHRLILATQDLSNKVFNTIEHPYAHKFEQEDQEPKSFVLDGQRYFKLNEIISNGTLSIGVSVQLALKILDFLEHIWNRDVIYNNLSPKSIYLTSQQDLKLVNFTNSSLTTVDYNNETELSAIRGDLHYVSPEQTGRMNRSIDYRSDMYSLGAIIYYVLTGKTLFQEENINEIIHSHLTKEPTPLRRHILEIPLIYDAIIRKLLSKNAEDRYQSSFGLKKDLQRVLEVLKNEIEDNPKLIAKDDFLGQFEITQKLYGRENELKSLLNNYAQVKYGKSKLLLVNGYSGIGKTALVNEVKKPITEHDGKFISGKFDQLKKSIPFYGLSQALSALVDQILLSDQDTIARWKDRLNETFQDNLNILCEVVPKIEKLIENKQFKQLDRSSSESQNLFYKTLHDFINLFKNSNEPLVIFLDDLQWADESTLGLIKYIFSNDKDENLLMIVGYRNNEVSANHPLQLTIKSIASIGTKIEELSLKELAYNDIANLLSDTLKRDKDSIRTLAETVLGKTSGNPFFSRNLIKTLYNKGLIYFDENIGIWLFKEDEILKLPISDNLLELLTENIEDLPKEELRVLQYASILGSTFESRKLMNLLNISKEELFTNLSGLVKKEYILPLDKYFRLLNTHKDFNLSANFKFSHDKVQQAAYASLEDREKNDIHYEITCLYKELIESNSIDIFEFTYHLNKVMDRFDDEKNFISDVNYQAGCKAFESTAYFAAKDHFEISFMMLGDDKWDNNYQFALNVATSLSECYYLCANTSAAKDLYNELLSIAKTKEDKAKVYEIQMNYYTNQGRADEAISIGAKALRLYGINFPEKTKFHQVLPKLLYVKARLSLISNDKLLNAPEMTNSDAKTALKILSNMSPSCFIQSPESMLLNCLNCLVLTLNYGNSDVSSYAISLMGFVEAVALSNYKRAEELITIATRINDRIDIGKLYKSKVIFAGNTFVQFYHAPIEESIQKLKEGHVSGIACGDFNFANYCLFSTLSREIFLGYNLNNTYLNAVDYSKFSDSISDQYIIPMMQIMRRFISKVTDTYDPVYIDKDKTYNIEESARNFKEVNDKQNQSFLFIYEGILEFLNENYDTAYDYVKRAEVVAEEGTQKQILLFDHYFFSVIISTTYYKYSGLEESTVKRLATRNLKKLKKVTDAMPANFRSRYHLACAQYNAVFNKTNSKEIIYHFTEALHFASEDGFTHIDAIACELYSKYMETLGASHLANDLKERAITNYYSWGATKKAESLELSRQQTPSINLEKEIDLKAIIKSSELLSKERNIDNLLDSIIDVAIKLSNAKRGAVIRRVDGRYFVASSSSSEQSVEYPISIIDFVYNSLDVVRIDSFDHISNFSKDSFFENNKVESVLALPLIANDVVHAVLYLENDHVKNIFTKDKTRILEILTTQMGLSIENASLFKNLENLVNIRTKELNKKTLLLEKSSLEKETLIKVLCHDLANLVMASKISIKRIDRKLKEINDEETQKHLLKIDRAFKNQSYIINNVRNMELAKNNLINVDLREVNLQSTLIHSIETFDNQASEKGIRFDIDPNLAEKTIIVDEISFVVNVLNNIIYNSIKFCFEGGVISIFLYEEDDETLTFAIKDNGIGMKEEMVASLFKKNVHTSTKGTSHEIGSGFGLNIIKTFVEKFGGSLTYQSKHMEESPDDHGTTCILTLKKKL